MPEQRIAQKVADLEEGDEFRLTFFDGETTHTTQQTVIDVDDVGDSKTVYGEDSPGWRSPSISISANTTGEPVLQDTLECAMQDPITVEEYVGFEVNPDGE